MFDHEVRWYALVPVSILLGFAVIFLETARVWGALPIRPDLFWCLACLTVFRSPPLPSLFVFAWCGFCRGILLGTRPGADTLAYIVTGWLYLHWKPFSLGRGWAGQAIMAATAAAATSLLRQALAYGFLAHTLWERVLVVAVGDGLLTCPAYLLMAGVLALPSFRTWRDGRE
ncbi:MAG: hypothetical protein LIP77_01290 [Planctomycetes bacterium]|nr:hypothetical protein [Planctomycetota bacterium]